MAISHDDCENSQNLGQSPTLITTVVLYLSTVNKGLSVGSKDKYKKANIFGKIGACSSFFIVTSLAAATDLFFMVYVTNMWERVA